MVIEVGFLDANWECIIIGFMVLEKIVKISKTQADDIVVDVIWKSLKRLVKK